MAGSPSISRAVGCTGTIRPSYLLAFKTRINLLPADTLVAEAPTTAIDFGANKGSNAPRIAEPSSSRAAMRRIPQGNSSIYSYQIVLADNQRIEIEFRNQIAVQRKEALCPSQDKQRVRDQRE